MNKKIGEIKLFNRELHDTLRVYKTVKTSDNKYKFIDFGVIKNGYLHQNNHILIQTIATIFRILPDYSEDYEYNIIENLRNEFHKLTICMGRSYGIIYWLVFFITTSAIIINEALNYNNFLNFILVLVMIAFSIIVNTKITYVPKLKRQKNYKRLFEIEQTKKKRGEESLCKYNLKHLWLINQDNVILNEFNNMKLTEFPNLKWTVLKKDIKEPFYFEIKLNSICNFLGFGVSKGINQDIFKILNPGIWLSSDSNKIGFSYRKEMKWIEENNLCKKNTKIGCGYINNKIFFVTPGKDKYCFEFNSSNLIICTPEETNFEIKDYNLDIIKENEFIFLPEVEFIYKQNINIEINKEIFLKENNFDNEIKISQFNTNNIKSYSIEMNRIGVEDIQQYIDKDAMSVIFYKSFSYKNGIKEILIDIDLSACVKPDFIAFGLVEEKSLYSSSYLNLIPGSRGFDSIGYHSDDGSVCISNKENDIAYTNKNLSWYKVGTIETLFRIKLGFDGSNLYFTNPYNERFTLNEINQINFWKSGNTFFPVIYFHGSNMDKLILKCRT